MLGRHAGGFAFHFVWLYHDLAAGRYHDYAFRYPLLINRGSPWLSYFPWLEVIEWMVLPLILSAWIGLATMRRCKKVCEECDWIESLGNGHIRKTEALRNNSD
jgi:hypothetical protein